MRFLRQSKAFGAGFSPTALMLGLCVVGGCSRRADPPGAATGGAPPAGPGREVGTASAEAEPPAPRGKASAVAAPADKADTLDNLPFDETGPDVVKIASIAWRSWIYTATCVPAPSSPRAGPSW